MYYYIEHTGVSKRDGAPGRGSGRYPLGSGDRPFQRMRERRRANFYQTGKDRLNWELEKINKKKAKSNPRKIMRLEEKEAKIKETLKDEQAVVNEGYKETTRTAAAGAILLSKLISDLMLMPIDPSMASRRLIKTSIIGSAYLMKRFS